MMSSSRNCCFETFMKCPGKSPEISWKKQLKCFPFNAKKDRHRTEKEERPWLRRCSPTTDSAAALLRERRLTTTAFSRRHYFSTRGYFRSVRQRKRGFSIVSYFHHFVTHPKGRKPSMPLDLAVTFVKNQRAAEEKNLVCDQRIQVYKVHAFFATLKTCLLCNSWKVFSSR